MPDLAVYDDLAGVASIELIDAALMKIENFPVEVSDLNVFYFDALSRSRMQQIVLNFAAIEAAGETAHLFWRLTDGSSIAVTEVTAQNYYDDLVERSAIRATQAWQEYLMFISNQATSLRDLENWKDSYRI